MTGWWSARVRPPVTVQGREDVEQPFPGGLRQRGGGQRPERGGGATDLLEVDPARLAQLEVGGDSALDLLGEGALEMVGDQFHELLARDLHDVPLGGRSWCRRFSHAVLLPTRRRRTHVRRG